MADSQHVVNLDSKNCFNAHVQLLMNVHIVTYIVSYIANLKYEWLALLTDHICIYKVYLTPHALP